jgi:hypothetical protein
MNEEIYNQQPPADITNLEKTASIASKDGELKLTL